MWERAAQVSWRLPGAGLARGVRSFMIHLSVHSSAHCVQCGRPCGPDLRPGGSVPDPLFPSLGSHDAAGASISSFKL